MTKYQEAETTGRIELAVHKLLAAARKRQWEAFDRHLERIAELRGHNRTVILNDVADTPGTTTVRIGVESDNLALIIHPEGTGTCLCPDLTRTQGRERASGCVERHSGARADAHHRPEQGGDTD